MARIPLRTSEVKAYSDPLRVSADPNAFGASVGKATQGLGDAVSSVGSQVTGFAAEEKAVLQNQEARSIVASSDYSKRMLERQQAAPADGKNFYEDTGRDYDAWVDERTRGITDSKVRTEVRSNLLARKQGYLSSSASFETNQQVGYSKKLADDALNAVENRVRANPADFDQALTDSLAVIDSRTEIPASQREAMKTAQTQSLSKRAFESRIAAADTPEALDGVVSDLTKNDVWQKRMLPADYDRILDGAKSGRSALNTKVDTEARAALDSVKDRNNNRELLDPAELAAVEASVKKSKNPGLQWGLAELKEQQSIYRQYKGLTPEQYRQKIAEQRGQQVSAGLPPEISDAVNEATGKVGISATYLAGMFNKEYGADLYAKVGSGSGNLAGTSSAVGIAQFTKGTAAAVARGNNGFNARIMGIDIAGKSDEQIHAMFKDPKVAMTGAALLARANANAMRPALGREPTDGELYMAHFLGAGGANTVIRGLQSDPNQSAAALLPEAAKANRSVFYGGGSEGGRPYTVAELYGRVTSSFMGGPSRVASVRATALQGLATAQEKALKDDMITYGSQSGRFVVNSLTDAASFAERGKTYTSMADYFAVPRSDGQPFTKGEAEALTQTVKNGNADDALNVLQMIQSMGGDAARAAAKQIGLTDSTFGFAAGLAADRGARDVAGDIIRGQKRVDADKDIKQAVGDDKLVTQSFNTIMGKSLMGVDPKMAQSIKDAALAHYVETHVTRSSGRFGVFDKSAYEASVNAVLGGAKGSNAVEAVNGEPTILPQGVTGHQFDQALDRFTIDDYMQMSKDGNPPRYRDGTVARAEDIAIEGKFRSIGGGEYIIEMGNGPLISAARGDRTATPYRFVANPDRIKKAATSAPPASSSTTPQSGGDGELPIMRPGGALPNFDATTGRWLGPTR